MNMLDVREDGGQGHMGGGGGLEVSSRLLSSVQEFKFK